MISLSVSDFQGKAFKFTNKASGNIKNLYLIGIYEVQVGLDDYNGYMVAYGDFNGDKSYFINNIRVDVVTIT